MPQKDEMNTLSQIMNRLTVKGYDKGIQVDLRKALLLMTKRISLKI
jgi:hypothetical protein